MHPQIVLAHDGSIHADWVSRYAIQMAATLPGQELFLVHFLDGTISPERIEEKFAAITGECTRHGLHCRAQIHPLHDDVFTSLCRVLPHGKAHYCLCGARIAARGRGFLAGTVSERLLRSGLCNVLALRVVLPGLLGCPRILLFPLAGHPRGFQAAMPFLHLLSRTIKRLHLLRVMAVNPLHLRYITAQKSRRRVAEGYDYLGQIAADIRTQTPAPSWHLDRQVLLSDDWAKEVLIQAGKVHAGMILLGASERGLAHRFFLGNRIEQILSAAPCDVGIYRKA